MGNRCRFFGRIFAGSGNDPQRCLPGFISLRQFSGLNENFEKQRKEKNISSARKN
ncbi:MAG: hypothetical protein ACLR1T_03855 [Evtepia gabavorous]